MEVGGSGASGCDCDCNLLVVLRDFEKSVGTHKCLEKKAWRSFSRLRLGWRCGLVMHVGFV